MTWEYLLVAIASCYIITGFIILINYRQYKLETEEEELIQAEEMEEDELW